MDERWSFVGKKANPQWLWLALDVGSRQILAFHVGDRGQKSARQLWDKRPLSGRAKVRAHVFEPTIFREQASFAQGFLIAQGKGPGFGLFG